MNRKGDISPSLRILVYLLVLLMFIFATFLIVSGKVGGTQTKISGVDPSSGSNSAKMIECQKKCGTSYSEPACTAPDPQLSGISCKTFLENLGRTLNISYQPQTLIVGSNSVTITIKNENGGPVSGADISGSYAGAFTENPAGTGKYAGTVDTTNVPLIEGKGHVELYITPPAASGYPSRTIALLIE